MYPFFMGCKLKKMWKVKAPVAPTTDEPIDCAPNLRPKPPGETSNKSYYSGSIDILFTEKVADMNTFVDNADDKNCIINMCSLMNQGCTTAY